MPNPSTSGISGQWVNAYGSLMNIVQFSNGLIWGEYSSTTGSSGKYTVMGFSPYGASGNQPVSLCIYWRSTAGGPPDPTWNWVSVMCGQLLTDAPGGVQLELLHSMIASSAYNAVDVYEPGAYTETLVFTSYTGNIAHSIKHVNPFDGLEPSPFVLSGTWKNKAANSHFPALNLQTYSSIALLDGTLATNANYIAVGGLYNSNLPPGMLQTVSLAGIYLDKNGMNAAISLGGFYDTVKNELSLIVFKSIATVYGAKYSCVNVLGGEHFVQS